jgi:hypothetical protein
MTVPNKLVLSTVDLSRLRLDPRSGLEKPARSQKSILFSTSLSCDEKSFIRLQPVYIMRLCRSKQRKEKFPSFMKKETVIKTTCSSNKTFFRLRQ